MYKVFRKDCIEDIELDSDYFNFDIELVIRLVEMGFNPIEVPVNYASRSFSVGKKGSFRRDPFQILKTMLRLRL